MIKTTVNNVQIRGHLSNWNDTLMHIQDKPQKNDDSHNSFYDMQWISMHSSNPICIIVNILRPCKNHIHFSTMQWFVTPKDFFEFFLKPSHGLTSRSWYKTTVFKSLWQLDRCYWLPRLESMAILNWLFSLILHSYVVGYIYYILT